MADPEESESDAPLEPRDGHHLPMWVLYVAVTVGLIAVAILAGRDEALNRHAADPYRLPEDAVGAFWMKVSALIAACEALLVGAIALLVSRLGIWVKGVGCLAILAGFVLLGLLTFNLYFGTFAAN
jgi:hypothetical protein